MVRRQSVGSRRTVGMLLTVLAVALGLSQPGSAQPDPLPEHRALREAVVERFEPVLLTGGIGLAPRDASTPVRLVEIRDGAIAVDGTIVTGQELRGLLGEDADLVARLSFVDTAIVRRLFGADPDTPVAADPPAVTPAGPSTDVGPTALPLERRTTSSGIVKIGGSVEVAVDERVRGDVVVLGGPLTVDGEVTGDVVLIGGPARFGPDAEVGGEVTVVGGPIDRARSAELRRGINQIGFGDLDIGALNLGDWAWWGGAGRWFSPSRYWGGWDLGSTVLRLIFFALIACVAVFAARGAVERTAARSAAQPLKAGVVGLLAQLLLAPVFGLGVLLLVVSIIGIPLLVLVPFAVLALFVIMLVGFAGSAHALGRWIRARLGLDTHPVYLSVWIGVALILVPTIAGEAFDVVGGPFRVIAMVLALAGLLLEYAAWTTGFGAIILNRFDTPVAHALTVEPTSAQTHH